MLYAHFADPVALNGLLQEGTHYKCGTNICYGSDGGATHATFIKLQTVANQAAQKYGLGTIDTDGFIGTATVTLIRAIAARATTVTTGALAQARGAFSKEVAAQHAQELIEQLQSLTTIQPPTIFIDPNEDPKTRTPTPPGDLAPIDPYADAPPPPAPVKSKVGLIVAVIGGIAIVGTIVAIVAIKRNPSPRG
jgi:hypothetical protein